MNNAMKAAGDFIMERKTITIGDAQSSRKRKPDAGILRFGKLQNRLFPFVAAVWGLFIAGCATQPGMAVKETSRTFATVVIDPGHGGKDSGTWSKARRGPKVLEKNAALDVGCRLDRKLRAAGFKTVMTRRSDVFVELNDRARISNAQTNAVFVSIHFNDSPKRKIHGIETYYHSSISMPLAKRIERNLDGIPGESDRGVKYANYRVLRLNQYPAVLVECGFLSNKNEAIRAGSADYRNHLADKIADALREQRFGTAPPENF